MSVYQFEVSMENHTKGEIYNFCRQFDLPGSGLGSGPSEIADACPDATVLDGIEVRGSDVSGSQSDIEKWIDGLSLDIQK